MQNPDFSGNVAFGLWEIVIGFAAIILVLGIVSCLFAYFRPHGTDGATRTINRIIDFLFYGVLTFIAVASLVTGEYGRFSILVVILIALKWNKWFAVRHRLGRKE